MPDVDYEKLFRSGRLQVSIPDSYEHREYAIRYLRFYLHVPEYPSLRKNYPTITEEEIASGVALPKDHLLNLLALPKEVLSSLLALPAEHFSEFLDGRKAREEQGVPLHSFKEEALAYMAPPVEVPEGGDTLEDNETLELKKAPEKKRGRPSKK